jgi:hypothetical protein
MKRTIGAAVLLLLLALGLAACGDSPTGTPVPTATTAATVTPAATSTPFNPIILTITAGANYTGSPIPQVAPATPTVPPTIANTAPTDFPVYSGFKLINLGVLGQQVAESLSQASKTARSSIYYTTDPYDKVAAFYNTELPKQGFTKVIEQALPDFTSLTGNVLLYSKGSGASMQVSGLIVLGPLDASLISVFGAAAPDASILKEGNSVAIILTGLTSDDLANFQRSFQMTGTTAASPGATTPSPTK